MCSAVCHVVVHRSDRRENSWPPFSATRIMRAMRMIMTTGPVTTQKYREHLDTCLFSSGGDAVLHRTNCIGEM